MLQACFILDFDLLARPRCDEPFLARVDVGIEPSDILDFAEILLGKEPFTKKVQGMLQVNGFTPATPIQMQSLTPQRREIWRRERARAHRTEPVALVDIAYADGGNSFTMPLLIESLTREMVKEGITQGFEFTSAITGETARAPYTVETCMEFSYFFHHHP